MARLIQFAFNLLILLEDFLHGDRLVFDFGAKVLVRLTGEIDVFQAICYPLNLTLERIDLFVKLLDLPQYLVVSFSAFLDDYGFLIVFLLDLYKVFILLVQRSIYTTSKLSSIFSQLFNLLTLFFYRCILPDQIQNNLLVILILVTILDHLDDFVELAHQYVDFADYCFLLGLKRFAVILPI